ncbi:MAG: rod-binding protein [Geobacteraceae bacterium]
MTTIGKPAIFPEVATSKLLSKVNDAGNSDASADKNAALKKTSQDFEALFIGMMLKSMRATVGKDTLTGGGRGEEVYRSMLDQEYAQEAAKAGTLGISKGLEEQLARYMGHSETNDSRSKS